MCDTIVALPSATASGGVLFGKNSDRERNEAQAVEFFPAADYPADATLVCTHIDIPQIRHTHATLLCRPFWLWGAEMGANEHGVVIGNEAVHPRYMTPRDPGLIGMDLLRLGLERAATAAAAVDVIIALLEQYGQGGNCGHMSERFYNNSFIVADPTEAFVLETAGYDWAVQRAAGTRAISNAYSIERGYDRISPALRDRLDGLPVSALTNLNQDSRGQGRLRCARSTALLRAKTGTIGLADMKAVLRDHGTDDDSDWHPADAVRRTVCMHAAEDERGGQTVNAMVSELIGNQAVHWVTGTAAPCLSIFKPVLPNRPIPNHGPRPTDQADSDSLWWRHERMHRAMLTHFTENHAAIRAERDTLEAKFRAQIAAVMASGTRADQTRVVEECWAEADATERGWAEATDAEAQPRNKYGAAWSEMNEAAGLA